MKIHEKYIKRCIQLAKNGLGTTYPNPLVGALIVHKNEIIGEGWHQKAGEPHAEVNAINSVKNKELLKESTLYVNLEPCSHYGKTPPCSDLIVQTNIKKVVMGALDSNSLVSGKGVEHLKNNGCEVIVGVLEQDCLELNKRFYTFHNKKRPFVILKWAQTQDGFIDIKRKVENIENAQPTWISNEYSRQLVHQFRTEEQAIFIGTETAIKDNPSLTARYFKGNNPIRIVLDKSLRIPIHYYIYDGLIKTIIVFDKNTVVNHQHKNITNIHFEAINFEESVVEQVLNLLHKHEIQSVIVEGGKQLLESFIYKNLWDEARVFTGNKLLMDGINAPQINGIKILENNILGDVLNIYKNSFSV